MKAVDFSKTSVYIYQNTRYRDIATKLHGVKPQKTFIYIIINFNVPQLTVILLVINLKFNSIPDLYKTLIYIYIYISQAIKLKVVTDY